MGIGTHLGIISQAGASSFTNTYSFEFDGTDDYISINDADDLSFGDGLTDSPFSISAWIKMTDATTFRIAFKSDNSATNNEYGLFTSGADQLFFQLYDETTSIKIGKFYTTALTSYEGQWIHIVGTYNGNSNTSGIKLYLNGIRVDNSGTSVGSYTAMHNTNASFEIGKYTTTYANGLIDELSIFNSELSQSDITSIYNSGVPNDISNISGLISWWRMGENATWNGREWNPIPDANGNNDGIGFNMDENSRSTDIPS